MGMHQRLAVSVCVTALAVAGLLGAPSAAADCNDSSDTTVCAQGDIRGTHAGPPASPTQGAWGTWCNGRVCFPGYGGFTVSVNP
jgi:hypothetical protein